MEKKKVIIDPEERNHIIYLLCTAMNKLDKLQVELCEDTPYEIPTAEECRTRIRSTFDNLDAVYEFITKL